MILVTGATGFVGRHAVAALRVNGCETIGVSRRLGLDLTDREAVRRFVAGRPITAVVHACGTHGRSTPEALLAAHTEATRNLLEALEPTRRSVRWLNIGSSAQYGRCAGELEETQPDRPLSPYARSKALQERLVAAVGGRGIVEPVFLRLFNPIGPGQSGPFLVPTILAQLRGGPRLKLANLDCVRDFVDIRDAAWAIAALLKSGRGIGERVNLCSGRGTSVEALARALAAAAGIEPEFEIDGSLIAPPDIPYQRGSIRKLRELCGWEGGRPLEETARDALAWTKSETSE